MIAFSKKNKRVLAASLAAAALLTLVLSNLGPSSKDQASAQYHKVEKGDLLISVTEGGTLQAVNKIAVENQLPGESKIVFIVPEGSRVNEGDLIVQLDTSTVEEQKKKLELEIVSDRSELTTALNNLAIEKSTVESEARAAQKAITFAKMDLEKFINLDKEQQIRNAETDISQAIDAHKIAEEKYNWSLQLAEKGFETKSQVDRDQLDLTAKATSLEVAKSKLEMLNLYDLPKQEAQLKSDVTESEEKYTREVKQGESKIARSEAALASKQNTLKLNLERLEKLNFQIAQASIKAPASGLILYKRGGRFSRQARIEQGATVQQNATLIEIPNSDQLKVVVMVPEFHINKMAVGLKANVSIDSIPNKVFSAKIQSVAVLPEDSGWLSSGEKSYAVEVLIDESLPNVKPSISAKAEITIAHLSKVISVPLQALKEEQGQLYCYVKSLSGDEKRPVQIGLMNNSFVEIKSGLEEGDEVLLTLPAD